MNIFFTSKCPIGCAKFLDNIRVNKMVVETAQMLSTAIVANGLNKVIKIPYSDLKTKKLKYNYYLNGRIVYKPTHKNHPSNVWVRQTKANYRWTLRHFAALCREYTQRYGKVHKSSTLIKEFISGYSLIPDGNLTPFVNCAANKSLNICFKHIEKVTIAYRLYLQYRWQNDKKKPVWS